MCICASGQQLDPEDPSKFEVYFVYIAISFLIGGLEPEKDAVSESVN